MVCPSSPRSRPPSVVGPRQPLSPIGTNPASTRKSAHQALIKPITPNSPKVAALSQSNPSSDESVSAAPIPKEAPLPDNLRCLTERTENALAPSSGSSSTACAVDSLDLHLDKASLPAPVELSTIDQKEEYKSLELYNWDLSEQRTNQDTDGHPLEFDGPAIFSPTPSLRLTFPVTECSTSTVVSPHTRPNSLLAPDAAEADLNQSYEAIAMMSISTPDDDHKTEAAGDNSRLSDGSFEMVKTEPQSGAALENRPTDAHNAQPSRPVTFSISPVIEIVNRKKAKCELSLSCPSRICV